MNTYLERLKNMPIGISGTCLAFITLSNSWLLHDITYLKSVAIFLASAMLALMLLRFICFPQVMWAELKNPVAGTFYPTMGMVLWLLCGHFYPKAPVLFSVLWLAAAVYHYAIAIFYTVIRIRERNFANIMPTCFIVYTGMITGSIASAGMDPSFLGGIIPAVANFMLMFGFTFYTLLLPLVLYIVFKSGNIDEKKLPVVGIICSPAPLGVVAMLTINPNPNPWMLLWLTVTGLALLPVVYGYILKLFPKGFQPMFAGFTFPLAIATLAAYKLGAYFGTLNMPLMEQAFTLLGNIEIFIASYVVLYVLIHFLTMFGKAVHSCFMESLLKKGICFGICPEM